MTSPILLTRPGADVPWGFRLQGGKDQQRPLTVQKVTPGSLASFSLVVGDVILEISNVDATQLTYSDAMEIIKGCGDRLEFGIASRSGVSRNIEQAGPPPSYIQQQYQQQQHQQPELQTAPSYLAGSCKADTASARTGGAPQGRTRVPQVPDAVINVASRTAQDKRPWTYAPDIQNLQQHRRRFQGKNLSPTTSAPRMRPGHINPLQTQSTQPRYAPGIGEIDGEAAKDEETKFVDGVYSGPQIPSKTFQRLQAFTPPNQSDVTGLARAAQRRQRRREKLNYEDRTAEPPSQEFDEAAYLAGRIPILGSQTPSAARGPSSYAPVRPATVEVEKVQRRAMVEEQEVEKPFDEQAYLAGRIPLVKGGTIDPSQFNLPSANGTSLQPAEPEEERDDNSKPFDERAYLAGRIPLVKGGPIDPTQFNVPERRVVKKYKDVNRPRLQQPFDENAYLQGKLNILGGQPDDKPHNRPTPSAKPEDALPSWCKSDDEMVSEDEYDEDSFLRGRIPIVRRSADRQLPPRAPREVDRPKYGPVRATWQKADVDDNRGGTCSETEFDERAFLAGRWRRHLVPDKEYSTDTESEIPSKTFRFLRRSVSSERSGDEEARFSTQRSRDSVNEEDGMSSDQEKPYDCYMYHGRKIPSKIFSRLRQTMDRKAAVERKAVPKDPIERLKEKSVESLGIDVDTVIEKLDIGSHDPNTYMEILKKSIEQNDDIRVEHDNDVTDF